MRESLCKGRRDGKGLLRGLFFVIGRHPQGRAVDANGNAVMSEPIQ